MPEDGEQYIDLGISHLRIVAVQLHVVYKELREAGFDKSESLYLISQLLVVSTPEVDSGPYRYDNYNDNERDDDDDGAGA